MERKAEEAGAGEGGRYFDPEKGRGRGGEPVWCVNHPGWMAAGYGGSFSHSKRHNRGLRQAKAERGLKLHKQEDQKMQTSTFLLQMGLKHWPQPFKLSSGTSLRESDFGVGIETNHSLANGCRGSIRCAASNGLEFNYVKNELRLKDGNKQGTLMFYSSHTPKYLLH